MVELTRVSRASFCRFNEDGASRPDRDMDLRYQIQRNALEGPSYGRPRITAELRRRGWTVNPKLVCRPLGEDNLLCVQAQFRWHHQLQPRPARVLQPACQYGAECQNNQKFAIPSKTLPP